MHGRIDAALFVNNYTFITKKYYLIHTQTVQLNLNIFFQTVLYEVSKPGVNNFWPSYWSRVISYKDDYIPADIHTHSFPNKLKIVNKPLGQMLCYSAEENQQEYCHISNVVDHKAELSSVGHWFIMPYECLEIVTVSDYIQEVSGIFSVWKGCGKSP